MKATGILACSVLGVASILGLGLVGSGAFALPAQFVSALGDSFGNDAEGVVQLDDSTFVMTGWTSVVKIPEPYVDTLALLLTKVVVDDTGGLHREWATALNGPGLGGPTDTTLHCMGEELIRVEEDSSYIVVGSTNAWGAGKNDILLGKFDSQGHYQHLRRKFAE